MNTLRIILSIAILSTLLACGDIVETRTPKPIDQTYQVTTADGQNYLVTIHDENEASIALLNGMSESVKEATFTFDDIDDVDIEVTFDDGSSIHISGDLDDEITVSDTSTNSAESITPENTTIQIVDTEAIEEVIMPVSPQLLYAEAPQLQGIALSNTHGCALDQHKQLWCWSKDTSSELAQQLDLNLPNFIVRVAHDSASAWQRIMVTEHAVYAIDTGNVVIVFGDDPHYHTHVAALIQHSAYDIHGSSDTDGSYTMCTTDLDSKLYCWNNSTHSSPSTLQHNVRDFFVVNDDYVVISDTNNQLRTLDMDGNTVATYAQTAQCTPHDIAVVDRSLYVHCTNNALYYTRVSSNMIARGPLSKVADNIKTISQSTAALYGVDATSGELIFVDRSNMYSNANIQDAQEVATNASEACVTTNTGQVRCSPLWEELLPADEQSTGTILGHEI